MPTAEELIQTLREMADNAPETRSKRMQILVTPTMFDTLKAISEASRLSMNEIINIALAEYLKGKE